MTVAQARVREALHELCYDGWPASVREIALRAGISTSTAHVHLHALEQQGRARQHPRNPQGGWRP